MNKTYFNDADDALHACDKLTREDFFDSEDRATLSAFYNGRQTMSESEADEKGVSELINHLFGYDSINTAAGQIDSMYSKSPTMWRINIKNAPEGFTQKWSQEVTKFFNKAIKDSGRFKPEWKALSGEVTLYGSFHFCFYDLFDWCPRARRPMTPRGTGTVPCDGDFFVVREELRLKELYAAMRQQERLSEDGLETGWKVDALRKAIKAFEDFYKDTNADTTVSANSGSESHGPTPEEQEINRQIDSTNAQRYELALPVYYLYTSRPDDEGCPFDLTIIARYPAAVSNNASENGTVLPTILFDKENYYPEAEEFLHSFFIDCNIGGKTLWHRSMGLGQLNYDSDVDVEEFFNDAMQGSKENLRTRYQVSNAADTEMVNRWLSGAEYSNVLPEGVSVAEVAKNPNFQHAFQTMEMLQNLTRRNASASISNTEGARATNELEVQALERQGRNAEAISGKMNDLYDGSEKLGNTIFGRFLNEDILPIDKGYKEIKRFQDNMKKKGIPLSFLRVKENGEFVNLDVKPNRVAGDGDKVRQVMVNQSLMSRLHLFSPQSQQQIIRMVTASETQDYDLAEELVPLEQELDGGQINLANNENQSSIQRGITGYVPQLNRDDIHQIHIPEHMGGLQGLLGKGEALGWDELDMAGFQSILKHLGLHLQQISNNPAAKGLANQVKQAIQGMIRQAQEFANNLQAKREAEQQQMEPKDAAKLQLEGAKFQLDERKQTSLESHRVEELDFKKEKAGVSASLELKGQNDRALLGEQQIIQQQISAEQEGAEKAREETLSGERSAQGA